jgi:tetratricopeptide (TPR) repeat protein
VLEKDPDDLTALRNLGVLLYDWKVGGQRGTYLAEAHDLLLRYVKGGGEVDASLADTWHTLQGYARGDTAAAKAADAHGLARAGELEQALARYEEAAELDPERIEYRIHQLELLPHIPRRLGEIEVRSAELLHDFPEDRRAREIRSQVILSRQTSAADADAEVHSTAVRDLAVMVAAAPKDTLLIATLGTSLYLAGGDGALERLDAEIPELAGLAPDVRSQVLDEMHSVARSAPPR